MAMREPVRSCSPVTWFEAAGLFLWALLVDLWFRGPLLGSRLSLQGSIRLSLLTAFLLVGWLVVRFRRGVFGWRDDSPFVAHVLLACVVATLVRLPALRAPSGLISSDSAVAGLIACDLRQGLLPPPIYAPGFPYEGTLKPHVTAGIGRILTGISTPTLYAWTSHLFYLLWMVTVMVWARDAGGVASATAAGLLMAVSPRFLTAFSLNNVGQYPEVSALGTLSLLLLLRGAWGASGFVLGIALWQQLLGLYFLLTAVLFVALTPSRRLKRCLLRFTASLAVSLTPVWIWNAENGWATFDWLHRGGKHPLDRLVGLPDQLLRTFSVSLPKLFGFTDAGTPMPLGAVCGALLFALVFVVAIVRHDHDARVRDARRLAAFLLFVVVATFAISKFSHRGAQRPRYLLPIYTSVAVGVGVAGAALWRRSRWVSITALGALLALNAVGLVPWLRARAHAQARDDDLVRVLRDLDVRTAYAGFWIGPKYTFLTEGHIVISGELGPDVSWVRPADAAAVRAEGPDAFIVPSGDLAGALEARLRELHVTHESTEAAGFTILYSLSRPVSLEQVAGYDQAIGETQPDLAPE